MIMEWREAGLLDTTIEYMVAVDNGHDLTEMRYFSAKINVRERPMILTNRTMTKKTQH